MSTPAAERVSTWACWCVVCGHRWQARSYPTRCPRNDCRSVLWDGRERRPVGRPRKQREE